MASVKSQMRFIGLIIVIVGYRNYRASFIIKECYRIIHYNQIIYYYYEISKLSLNLQCH